jgi:hypothetical protein
MWADVMTKPLQGMAFKTMRSELMNCKDPPEMGEDKGAKNETGIRRMGKTKQTQPSAKTVTWKRVIVTPFRRQQECVEKSEGYLSRVMMNRRLGRSMHH